MSSANSLSFCQAVCCTEFALLSPWALAGHTSCHPSPTVPPTSLCVFSASLYKPGCSDPPFLATFSLLSVSPRQSASMVSVQTGGGLLTKQQAFRRHINCRHSSVRLESLVHNQRTRTPVRLSGHEQTQQWDCRPQERPWRMLHIPQVPNKKQISSNHSRRDPCSLTVVMTAL